MTSELALPVYTSLLIHYSDTKDDGVNADWPAIRKYHMSWRHDGEIITEERARELLAGGAKGVEVPWADIGYQFGVERVGGAVILQEGRPLTMPGAHCNQHGPDGISLNLTSIGICFVGDFDLEPPADDVYEAGAMLCSSLIMKFPTIRPDRIWPHRQFAPWKTCPGTRFDMDRLVKFTKFFLQES